jgi:allantoate deiminase
MTLGETLLAQADELAEHSAERGKLTRLFLTPELRGASELVLRWMREAGMSARIDPIGNVVGRYEGLRPGLPALLMGSHLDTVRNAGKYDGMLGVIAAIACVKQLHRQGERLPFAIEVIGFGDEEGVRFGATLMGSRAVAGKFDPAWLDLKDGGGMTLAAALRAYGLDPGAIAAVAHRPENVLAYVELHIEQGPVLEAKSLPVGVVTAIAGVYRGEVTLTGMAGHAGTVPMGGRRDALAAAADCVLAVERLCGARAAEGVVGTVGRIEALPGAVNVIPGSARFSIDIRAPEDGVRRAAYQAVRTRIDAIAAHRGVTVEWRPLLEADAARCAPWLMDRIAAAVRAEGCSEFRLMSGAGHDGMALVGLCDIGMIFVRCKAGISHNPAEAITAEDADIGARVLLRFIRDFEPKKKTP